MKEANDGMSMGMDMDMNMHDGMHMTFFWGKNVQVLFSGWPGHRPGATPYFLSLFLVFFIAAAVEFLAYFSRRFGSPSRWTTSTTSRLCGGAALTAIHALRVGLAYIVMLAVMSFNVGILVAAIIGHAVGFLLSGSGAVLPRPSDGKN